MTTEKIIKECRDHFQAHSETKTIVEIPYRQLDEIITAYFGQSKGILPSGGRSGYECVAYEEWSNDSQHSFDVDPDEDIDEDVIEGAYKGQWEHYSLSDYLNLLSRAGIIPKCELIVSVCW